MHEAHGCWLLSEPAARVQLERVWPKQAACLQRSHVPSPTRTPPFALVQPEIRKCLDAVLLLLAQQEAGEQVGTLQLCCRWLAPCTTHPCCCLLQVLPLQPSLRAWVMPFVHVPCLALLHTYTCMVIRCHLPAPPALSHLPPPCAALRSPDKQTVLDFSLSDQVYARARLADVSSVNLWLGAGVMLEYSLEDAKVCGGSWLWQLLL